MALAQLTIIPIGEGSSVGFHVAKIKEELDNENISFQINDMATIIEAETDHLLRIVARLHCIPFENGAQRVITNLNIDERRDKTIHLGDKVESLKKRTEETNI